MQTLLLPFLYIDYCPKPAPVACKESHGDSHTVWPHLEHRARTKGPAVIITEPETTGDKIKCGIDSMSLWLCAWLRGYEERCLYRMTREKSKNKLRTLRGVSQEMEKAAKPGMERESLWRACGGL